MSLAKRLKTIYTSGDQFTVLTLINKLIEEVEKYEVESRPLYLHRLLVAGGGFVIYLAIPTEVSTKFTAEEFHNFLTKFGSYPCTGSDAHQGTYNSVINVKKGSTVGTVKVAVLTTGSTGSVQDTDDITIQVLSDEVHEIKEVQQ